MMKLTPTQATQQGFTVDRTCYPWFAYKGARFNPAASYECYTDMEAELMEYIDGCDDGRARALRRKYGT